MNKQSPTWQAGVANFLQQADVNNVAEICGLLRNRRRQYIVWCLCAQPDEWIPVRDVARWVTAVVHEYSLSDARGDDYRSVRESLRHTHLDALDAAGVIKTNDQQTEVRPGPRFDEVASILIQLLATSI